MVEWSSKSRVEDGEALDVFLFMVVLLLLVIEVVNLSSISPCLEPLRHHDEGLGLVWLSLSSLSNDFWVLLETLLAIFSSGSLSSIFLTVFST